MTAEISKRCWIKASSSPIGRASRRDGAKARREALYEAAASPAISKSRRPPRDEMGGIRFEANGRVTLVTGHPRLRPGPCLGLRPGRLPTSSASPSTSSTWFRVTATSCWRAAAPADRDRSCPAARPCSKPRPRSSNRARALAAHHLETAKADVEFVLSDAGEGLFRIKGTDREITLLDLAAAHADPSLRPESLEAGLDVALVSEAPPFAFPNGCHITEVEIDPDTGRCQPRSLCRPRRFRHAGQSHARRGPGAWRRGSRHRPGPARTHGL